LEKVKFFEDNNLFVAVVYFHPCLCLTNHARFMQCGKHKNVFFCMAWPPKRVSLALMVASIASIAFFEAKYYF